jgi:putative nucleotidyltransferase-like protein
MPEPELDLSPEARQELRRLRLDVATRQFIEALRGEGIPSILLRGPAIALWLYEGKRWYSDIDLLLPPWSLDRAYEFAGRLGYTCTSFLPSSAYDRPLSNTKWLRDSDGIKLELHRTLDGVAVTDEVAWDTFAAETEELAFGVGRFQATVLRPPARAFVIAVHAAHHGPTFSQPVEDLALALERLPRGEWTRAAALAKRLEATAAFAAGLRLHPEGEAVANSIGLPRTRSVETELSATGAPPMALMFEWLGQLEGLRPKAIFLAREIFPPPRFMRVASRLAQRGHGGLAVAYVWRPFSLLWRVPRALAAWRRARRRTGKR